jgi:hypothetical protein
MKASPKSMLAALPVLFGLALLGARVHAQATLTQPAVLTNAILNNPIQFDVSQPLRDLPVEAALPAGGVYVMHPPLRPKLQKRIGASQSPVAGPLPAAPGSLISATISATIGQSFEGVGQTSIHSCPSVTGFKVVPPDTNLAVGDTQIVQWVNLCYAVFDKATGSLIAGPFAGNHFWAGFGGACQSRNDGDPIIQWDKANHRWVASQNTFAPPYKTCVAVSQTADATGSYNRYAFPQTQGFPDYPKWGLTPNVYYQTQNVFDVTVPSQPFVGVNVCAYDGRAMRAGRSTARQICVFDNFTFDTSMLPADNDFNNEDYEDYDSTATRPEVLLGSIDQVNPGTNVYEYVFTVNFRNGTAVLAGINGTMPIPVPLFTLAECPYPINTFCVPQPSAGSELLDTLGDRLMYRLAHFDNDSRQYWLVTHSVMGTPAVNARWYQFTAPKGSTSLTLAQSGDTANDGKYRWMGSVAMDKVGDIALGYSRSSATPGDYPSIYYAGQTAGDAPNTTESEALIHQGGGSQFNAFNRWGDYSSMALDGTDGCRFWYTNEYYPVDGAVTGPGRAAWATWIASVKFPNCAEDDDGEGGDDNRDHVKFNDDPSHPETSSMAYQDPSRGMNLQSVNGVPSILYNGTCVSLTGDALVNNQPGYLYTFAACDLSALGTGIGSFSIAITGPPLFLYQKSAVLTSGHLNIHPH